MHKLALELYEARIKKADGRVASDRRQVRHDMACGGDTAPLVLDPDDPEYYKHHRHDRSNTDVEDIYRHWDSLVADSDLPVLSSIITELAADPPSTERQLEQALIQQRKRRKCAFRKAQLLYAYQRLVGQGTLDACPQLASLLVKKSSKSQSGVLVITVLTSPYPRFGETVQKFSCAWDCHYCPSEPNQPKSYLHDEPAVKRANENQFDAVLQLTDRAATLAMNGHPVDKIELLVLGGTWSSYPHEYQEEFCRDLFYAANTFWQRVKRPRGTLEEEQSANEEASCKIIGLTLETRPDTIDAAELRRLRRYGCTRVQLGLQHTDDAVLKKINRGCTTVDAATALRRLKDACFKIDVHLMPNLPGASLAADQAMFERMLRDEALQADQWKIYPTQVVPWTKIKTWFDEGAYVPYPLEHMYELLVQVKSRVHPWIRLNRVVRDIPMQYVLGGLDVPNMREDVAATMATRGLACRCIRCREVGGNLRSAGAPRLTHRGYRASGGAEHFLAFESADRATIFGFLRLRLRDPPGRARDALRALVARNGRAADAAAEEAVALAAAAVEAFDDDDGGGGGAVPFDELRGAVALVRELHVYGQLIATDNKTAADAQHTGLGRALMADAERRARAHGCREVAVIAGVGARGYYRKLGYELRGDGGFMLKRLAFFSPGWREAYALPARAAHIVASALLLPALALAAAIALLSTGQGGTLVVVV
tara:strand:+ start:2274 stop:4409 length:2136 start_codon:yes stop_codon:yes gene_type:complete